MCAVTAQEVPTAASEMPAPASAGANGRILCTTAQSLTQCCMHVRTSRCCPASVLVRIPAKTWPAPTHRHDACACNHNSQHHGIAAPAVGCAVCNEWSVFCKRHSAAAVRLRKRAVGALQLAVAPCQSVFDDNNNNTYNWATVAASKFTQVPPVSTGPQ